MDLVVDCSRKGVSLGLYANNKNYEIIEPKAKGDELNSLLDNLLQKNNFKLAQIKRVLVLLGPGSFTGIRIGIAFCEGLCFAGKRTLHGISTLKALSLAYQKQIFLYARANFYYTIEQGQEVLKQITEGIETDEYLPITPIAKLIDSIPSSKIQKANYIANPYS